MRIALAAAFTVALAGCSQPKMDEAQAITKGRELGYAGDFRGAVDWYTQALAEHPDSYRLLRHRGHRHISLREFDLAEQDLERAWELAKDQPNRIEPDGRPTPGVPPRGTDHGAILYHLGLARYLQGDFDGAAETFAEGVRRAENDDSVTSCSYWLYLAQARDGRPEAARATLDRIGTAMDVRENTTYYRLLLVYKGALDPRELAPQDGPLGIAVDEATLGYGMGMREQLAGSPQEARRWWESVCAKANPNAFGAIAAEAELKR